MDGELKLPFRVKAKANYTARNDTEVSLIYEQIYVVSDTDGKGLWWQTTTGGTVGWFPCSYGDVVDEGSGITADDVVEREVKEEIHHGKRKGSKHIRGREDKVKGRDEKKKKEMNLKTRSKSAKPKQSRGDKVIQTARDRSKKTSLDEMKEVDVDSPVPLDNIKKTKSTKEKNSKSSRKTKSKEVFSGEIIEEEISPDSRHENSKEKHSKSSRKRKSFKENELSSGGQDAIEDLSSGAKNTKVVSKTSRKTKSKEIDLNNDDKTAIQVPKKSRSTRGHVLVKTHSLEHMEHENYLDLDDMGDLGNIDPETLDIRNQNLILDSKRKEPKDPFHKMQSARGHARVKKGLDLEIGQPSIGTKMSKKNRSASTQIKPSTVREAAKLEKIKSKKLKKGKKTKDNLKGSRYHPKKKLAKFKKIIDKYKTIEDVQEALSRAGLESSNLILGVDYTKSNNWTGQHTFRGQCLHSISEEKRNPYFEVISIIGEALAPFDDDGLIPVFGFGDIETKDISVFPFYEDRPCDGFEEVLERYLELTPTIQLSGPTSFAPLIDKAIEIVKEKEEYHILVIIADGQVSDPTDTVEAIIEASYYPISIIMVGVGDGPWDTMEEFDDGLPQRNFDNFQFVEFHKVYDRYHTSAAFAVEALQEIPDQYQNIIQLGLIPTKQLDK